MDVTEEEMKSSGVKILAIQAMAERKKLWEFLVRNQLSGCAQNLFLEGYDSMSDVRKNFDQAMNDCGLKGPHQKKLRRELNPTGAPAQDQQQHEPVTPQRVAPHTRHATDMRSC